MNKDKNVGIYYDMLDRRIKLKELAKEIDFQEERLREMKYRFDKGIEEINKLKLMLEE